MRRSKTKTFIITRAMDLEEWQCDKLDKKFNAANRIYNSGVKHSIKMLKALKDY